MQCGKGKVGTKHKVPPQTKKLFEFDMFWDKANQFSLTKWHWVYQPYSKMSPCPGVVDQHKLNIMFLLCILELSMFLFFQQEKEHEARWIVELYNWEDRGRGKWSKYNVWNPQK